MNLRVLEVLVAFGCLALLIVLLVTLPGLVEEGMMEGFAYIVALVVFIVVLSAAGYLIDKMAA